MAIIVGNSKPDPNNGSPIEVTPELAAKVAAASSQSEVQQIMYDAMQKQYAPDGSLKRDFTINGQTYVVTGSSEAEILEQQNEIYRRVLTPERSTSMLRLRTTGLSLLGVRNWKCSIDSAKFP
jgi:hypothetical protein